MIFACAVLLSALAHFAMCQSQGQSSVVVETSNIAAISGAFSVNGNGVACDEKTPVARLNLVNHLPANPISVRFSFTPSFLLSAGVPAGSRLLSYDILAFASMSQSPPSLALTRTVLELQVNSTAQFVAQSQASVAIGRPLTPQIALSPVADWANAQPMSDGRVVVLANSSSPFTVSITLSFTLMESTANPTFLEVDCCHLRVNYVMSDPTTTTATMRTTRTTTVTTARPTPFPTPAPTPVPTPVPIVPTPAPTPVPTTTPKQTSSTTTPSAATPSATTTSTTTRSATTTPTVRPTPKPTPTAVISPAFTTRGSLLSSAMASIATAGVIGGDSGGTGEIFTTEQSSLSADADSTTNMASTTSATPLATTQSGAQDMFAPTASGDVGLYVGLGIGACVLMSVVVAFIVVMRVRKRNRKARMAVVEDDGDELSARPMSPKYSTLPTTREIAPVSTAAQYGSAPRRQKDDENNYVVGEFASE